MTQTNPMQTAETALQITRDLGIGDAAVTVSRTRFIEISYRDDKIEKVQESTKQSLGTTLYHEGRYSSSSTCDLRPEAVRAFLTQARDLTALLSVDPHRSITDPALYEGQADVDLQLGDPDYGSLTVDRRKELAAALHDAARGDERVISALGYVYDEISEGVRVHSNGFAGRTSGTSYWMMAQVTVRDEGDARPLGTWYVGDRRHGQLPEPAPIGERALERAL